MYSDFFDVPMITLLKFVILLLYEHRLLAGHVSTSHRIVEQGGQESTGSVSRLSWCAPTKIIVLRISRFCLGQRRWGICSRLILFDFVLRESCFNYFSEHVHSCSFSSHNLIHQRLVHASFRNEFSPMTMHLNQQVSSLPSINVTAQIRTLTERSDFVVSCQQPSSSRTQGPARFPSSSKMISVGS